MKIPQLSRILSLIVILVIISTYVLAAVPNTMNYQGQLTDDQGQSVNATISMTFTIYDAETNGNSKWSENHPSVSVVDGLFSVVLGQGTPAVPIEDTVFTSPDRWLEIAVGGETIIPRTKLASSPYSLQAGWTLAGNVLFTSGEYGIARAGNDVLGTNDSTHVNLGVTSSTGREGSDQFYCTVGGGRNNTASYTYSTVSGGSSNRADSTHATVGGGSSNMANGSISTVSGGYGNVAGIGTASTVSGGANNTASAYASTVGGGQENTAEATFSVVAGGESHTASGVYSTVGGGHWNEATGWVSTIPGGDFCTATGRFSFAAGREANAIHDGAWVWADTTDEDFESTGPNQFLIRASGYVGINTTTPMSPLHVQSANNWAADIGNGWGDFNVGDTTHGLSIGVATEGGGAGSVRMWTAGGNGNLTFGNATNGDFMTVKGTGKVGIGTTNPDDILHVSAGAPSVIVDATDEADAKLLFRDADDPSNQSFEIAFNADDQDLHIRSDDNSGADIITIRNGGNVGIGEVNPSVSLHVDGSICYTTSIGACSDARYKKDIQTISSAADKIDKLRGVSFNWRTDEYPTQKFNDKPQLGLIAQEVKEVFPELVMQDDNGYYSVDYVKLTPVLVEAIKELKAENDLKKVKINDLQAQIVHLTSQMEGVLEHIKWNDNTKRASGE